MGEMSLLFAGALIGVSVAAPVGPMGVLCINRTLAQGMRAGISTGVGSSTVHVLYCGLLLLGLHPLGCWLDGNSRTMSLLGALLMLLFAARLLLVRRPATPRRATLPLLAAYGSAVAFNIANPMTFVLLMGATASAFGPRLLTGTEIGMVLLGLAVGSVGWWIGLSGATAALHGRIGAGALGLVNRAVAVALIGFSVVALVRVL